jgi:hypothetical protein
MISLAPGTKVFLACSPIDLGAGFNGLAAKVQQMIGQDPFGGSLYIFAVNGVTISRHSIGMAAVYGCLPSGSRKVVSYGRLSSTVR